MRRFQRFRWYSVPCFLGDRDTDSNCIRLLASSVRANKHERAISDTRSQADDFCKISTASHALCFAERISHVVCSRNTTSVSVMANGVGYKPAFQHEKVVLLYAAVLLSEHTSSSIMDTSFIAKMSGHERHFSSPQALWVGLEE